MIHFHHTRKHYEIDMTSGPLTKKLLFFSAPLMLSGILQLLYNAADIVVVGRFAGSVALAAVGSTSSLINLIVNLLIGFSVGASVAVAQAYGAGDHGEANKTVHTAMTISAVGGLAVGVFGMIAAGWLLALMGTPEDVLPHATLYLRIYFGGVPVLMIYNFGAAVLRAVGDTRRPLYYLTISGIVNVVLNLVLVIGFGLGVAGVAIATVISEAISAVLILMCLFRSSGCTQLRLSMLGVRKDKLALIARIGLPAGLQGTIFSLSNVMIQSTVNSFGAIAMAGNAVASNIEGFLNTSINAIGQGALTFAGQNMGAGNYRRVGKVAGNCALLVAGLSLGLGGLAILFGPGLLGVYTTDASVVEMGMIRLRLMCGTYILCGMMDMLVCTLRGMGHSLMPMLVSTLGVVGVRIMYLLFIFPRVPTLFSLYLSYPVSWAATASIHFICYLAVYRKLTRQPA